MQSLYLNDPDGRKEAKLTDVQIDNPRVLLDSSSDFLCDYFVHCDKSRLFFAQNVSTHLAKILSVVKNTKSDIQKVYVSDHEISWMKEMLEVSGYQPDATHSN